jgi:hypothetical protein
MRAIVSIERRDAKGRKEQATDAYLVSLLVRPILPPLGSGIVRAKPRLRGPVLGVPPVGNAYLGLWTLDEGT